MEDMISIIIPIYNRQDVIGDCLRSVQNQTHQNFEIIIIDDGSTDQTLEICRLAAAEDSRIILLESEHSGVSAARNKGIDIAKGEYLFFIDSDDTIHPLLLDTLIKGMQSSDASVAGTGVVHIPYKHWEKVDEIISADSGPGVTTYQNHEETLRAVFMGDTSPINIIGGVMMRRDLVGETRFNTDLFIGEDFYFIYQNLIKGASSVFLKQKWYYVRAHLHNSSKNYGFEAFWSRFHRRELIWKSEEALGRTEYANRQKRFALSAFTLCISKNKVFSKDSIKMRRVLRKYQKEIVPAMVRNGKIRYLLYAYFPFTHLILSKIQRSSKNK